MCYKMSQSSMYLCPPHSLGPYSFQWQVRPIRISANCSRLPFCSVTPSPLWLPGTLERTLLQVPSPPLKPLIHTLDGEIVSKHKMLPWLGSQKWSRRQHQFGGILNASRREFGKTAASYTYSSVNYESGGEAAVLILAPGTSRWRFSQTDRTEDNG